MFRICLLALALISITATSSTAAWLSGYGNCRYRLTSTGVTGTHTDVPLVVKMPKALEGAKADFSDLRVMNGDSLVLDHQVVSVEDDHLQLWFNAPSSSPGCQKRPGMNTATCLRGCERLMPN